MDGIISPQFPPKGVGATCALSVSVVIPAFNAATTLRDALKSALDQTLPPKEILVVDDGSSDGTDIIAITHEDRGVQLIRQDNRGAAAARNAGIRAASGNFIAFLDADDVWLPTKLEQQTSFMSEREVDASQTAAWFVDRNLRPLYIGPAPPYSDPLLDVLLFKSLPALSSTLVVKKDLLEHVGYFDETLTILEDWDMAIRIARFGSLDNLNCPLTLYRQYPGNRSKNFGIHVSPGLTVLERLFIDPGLPNRIKRKRRRIYASLYSMYCGGALKAGSFGDGLRWGIRALRTHPYALSRIAGLPFRWIHRHRSRAVRDVRWPVAQGR